MDNFIRRQWIKEAIRIIPFVYRSLRNLSNKIGADSVFILYGIYIIGHRIDSISECNKSLWGK